MGLSTANGSLISVLLLTYWKHKSDDDVVLGFMTNVLEKIKLDAAGLGSLVPYVYMNYSWIDQDPITSYNVENKEKL